MQGRSFVLLTTIMLVVITIGLISTAYLYFSSIVTVGPVLSVASGYCNTSKIISVTESIPPGFRALNISCNAAC